jgi:uncharacterized protein (TIGR02677 family)
VLERRWEGRRRAASLPQDFRALARWFAAAESEAEAHRLFNAAFGLWPARHAHLVPPDAEAVPSTASWLDAPAVEVAPALRTSGSLQERGRGAPVADPAMVRVRRQAEQAAELASSRALRARLHTGGALRLSEFGALDRDTFAELLALLAHALSAPASSDGARRARSPDGGVEIVLRPIRDGRTARLATDAGVLGAPDDEVEITVGGMDAAALEASGGA